MILDSLTLDKVLAVVKDNYTSRRRKLDATISQITRLTTLYAQAAEADIVRELAVSMHLELHPDMRTPQAQKLAEELWSIIETLPELGGVLDDEVDSEDPEAGTEDAEAAVEAASNYRMLSEVTAKYPAILFGGAVLGERIDWLEKRGVVATWYAVPKSTGSMRDTLKAVEAVQSGNIGFVLLAHRLVSHKAANQIKEAARKANIPVATVGKAGYGQLVSALNGLETRYANLVNKMDG